MSKPSLLLEHYLQLQGDLKAEKFHFLLTEVLDV